MPTTAEQWQDTGPVRGGRRPMVAGVDGSPGSRAALEAAMRAADLRGDALRVVTAYVPEDEMGAWGNGAWAAVPPPDPERLRGAAQAVAEDTIKDVLGRLREGLRSEPTIDVQVSAGHPARVLRDAARDADRLFVGHRGRGAVSSLLLGSVGLHSVAGAPCPITVVPAADVGATPATQRRDVVVCGVDGSSGSRYALVEAMRSAARAGARVRVVAVYEPPETWAAWGYGPASAIPVPDAQDLADRASSEARQLVDEVHEALGTEGMATPETTVEAVVGHPAEVLVDLARDADELVVGHRGRGAAGSVLLGSVGLDCALHASCPVTIVPAADKT